jgi:hypothetical protein
MNTLMCNCVEVVPIRLSTQSVMGRKTSMLSPYKSAYRDLAPPTGVSQGASAEYRCCGLRMSRVNAHDRKTGLLTNKGLLLRARLTYSLRGAPQPQ